MREPNGLIKKAAEIRYLEEPAERAAPLPPPVVGYDGDEGEVQLRDYLRAVLKRKWMIIGITLLSTVLAAVYVARKPDVYQAEARVQVDLENNPALGSSKSGSIIVSSPVNDPSYFNTQLQILTGSGLLRRVVKTLDLEHNQAFLRPDSGTDAARTWQNLKRMVGLGGKGEDGEQNQAQDEILLASSVAPPTAGDDVAEARRLAPYVRALQGGLQVEPVKETRLANRETRLIDISFSHRDPQVAAKIVNAIIDTFVLSNLERKTETNASAGDFLQRRVAEIQAQIRNGEERLLNYAKSHQILSLDATQNTVVERLAGLNRQLLEAENELKMAEAAYRAGLAPGAADALAEGQGSRTAGAEDKLGELRQRRAQLLVENTEEWQEVKEVTRQIAVLEKQIQDSRAHASTVILSNLETRYRQAQAREQALRAAFDRQRAETLAQNEAAVQYRIIQQEIETNKSLLDGLLQRSKENEVVMQGTANNIHVVDRALMPDSPIGPMRTQRVAMMFILSLGFGIGLALLSDYLDNSISTIDDVERVLRLPAIAAIPTVAGAAPLPKAGVLQRRNGKAHAGKTFQALLTSPDAPGPLVESYRHLRTSVLLSTAGRAPKTLLVASSQPSEGKTTTAVNLAISLAQTGASVIIVDADMRRPCLHSIFNLDNDRGLSTILASEMGEAEKYSIIDQDVTVDRLHLLTAGPTPPNPAELLGSEQMRRLVATLEASFRYVIIDSPPIAPFTDSVLIASVVDGVLLVVNSGKSSREVTRRSQKVLHDTGARLLGVVLNNAEVNSESYYY